MVLSLRDQPLAHRTNVDIERLQRLSRQPFFVTIRMKPSCNISPDPHTFGDFGLDPAPAHRCFDFLSEGNRRIANERHHTHSH
jgi:hypothetical protein